MYIINSDLYVQKVNKRVQKAVYNALVHLWHENKHVFLILLIPLMQYCSAIWILLTRCDGWNKQNVGKDVNKSMLESWESSETGLQSLMSDGSSLGFLNV